ncbi:MAG: hypothetical protein AAFN74_23270 [Myxococcota bacterium]
MLGVSLAGLFLVAALPASTTSVQWNWIRLPGAEHCPDGHTLSSRIAARLGRDPFHDPAHIVIEGLVDRYPPGWRVRLFVRDPRGSLRGERTLVAPRGDCAGIVDAAILVAVLAIEAEASAHLELDADAASQTELAIDAGSSSRSELEADAASQAESRPASEARLHISPGARRVSPLKPALRPRTESRLPTVKVPVSSDKKWPGAARLQAGLLIGTLPDPSVGFGVAVEVPVRGEVSLGAGAGFWLAQQAAFGDAGLAALWLEGCWRPFLRPLSLSVCGLGYVGALRVSVDAFSDEVEPLDPGQFLWAAIAPGARAVWFPLGPVRLGLEVTLPISLTRQAFRVDGAEVFRESPVALHAVFSIGLTI